ncbi:hypothetical protein BGX24_000827 [Mortierella sp. AD032]|nr:hypothetical protein BGX24_000827 [Mortierella sp. AD032]
MPEDHLQKPNSHAVGSDDARSKPIRKRDKVRNFLGIPEIKSKASNQSLNTQPPSQQLARPSSIASQTGNSSSGDNQYLSLNAVQEKPLPLPPTSHRPGLEEIFTNNVAKPALRTELPRLRQRIERTQQLAYCFSLLPKDSLAPLVVLGEAAISDPSTALQEPTLSQSELDWLDEMKKDPMEQDRLLWLVTRMVKEFVADTTKDSTEIAEIARILNITLLQGLVQLIEGASPGCLQDDDLVKILAILRRRLQATHKPSSKHVYQMTVAISRLLDVMVNVMVKDVNRTEDFQPLVAVLDDLRETSDVTLQFQVHYALQASQYIPDDESTLQAVLRFAGGVSMAVLGVASVCKLDPANLFSSLETLRQATGQLFEVTKSILEGLEASQRGRFGAMQSLGPSMSGI